MKKIINNILEFFHILIIFVVLMKWIRKGLWKTLMREVKEPGYMSQESFSTCMDRAKDMMHEAIETAIRVFAYMIASHRIKNHHEDRSEELNKIDGLLKASGAKVSSRAWWKG